MSDERAPLGSQATMVAESELGSQSSVTNAPLAPPPLIGGRYEVLALAGAGAMGSVYRARDVELDEIVALKFLRAGLGGSPVMLERFRREVKLARRVTHPNVARVFDIGEHGSDKFLTMEFIDGEVLSALLLREGALPLHRALRLAHPICEGLSAAHAVGVVHRDLKPDNVMLTRNGRPVITDFGIARSAFGERDGATMGAVVGTPAYMAPEQVEGATDIDQRADVYALGVMLFEMLTGSLPFSGATPIMMASARLSRPAPDPRSIRPELEPAAAEIVLRCMARRPQERFSAAEHVRLALLSLGSVTQTASAMERPVPIAQVAPAATAIGDKTVAVLPFKNLGSPQDAYIADGLTEDLVDTLSMAAGLRVRPRSALGKLDASATDPAAIGRELDVQVIVEGSLRRRGDTLRISARLVSVAEGFQLWARRFDRPAGDVLVVSDEVADSVAEALTVAPAGQHREAPTDPLAIDLYLRARAELRLLNVEPLRRAVNLLEQATERAPSDGAILAAYARAEVRLWFFEASGDVDGFRRALDLAERAVAAAPDRGEALLALAQVRFAGGEYGEAARLAARAVSHSPLLPEAHELVGRMLLEIGLCPSGLSSMERARSLDPLVEAPILELCRTWALQGDFARAKQFLDDNPSQRGVVSRAPMIARFALWSRNPEEWTSLLQPLQSTDPDSPLQVAIAALNVIRTKQLPPELVARVRELGSHPKRAIRFRALLNQIGAEFHAYVGQAEQALEHIEIAATHDGLIDLAWLDMCPLLDFVRTEPRFVRARAIVVARADEIRAALGA